MDLWKIFSTINTSNDVKILTYIEGSIKVWVCLKTSFLEQFKSKRLFTEDPIKDPRRWGDKLTIGDTVVRGWRCYTFVVDDIEDLCDNTYFRTGIYSILKALGVSDDEIKKMFTFEDDKEGDNDNIDDTDITFEIETDDNDDEVVLDLTKDDDFEIVEPESSTSIETDSQVYHYQDFVKDVIYEELNNLAKQKKNLRVLDLAPHAPVMVYKSSRIFVEVPKDIDFFIYLNDIVQDTSKPRYDAVVASRILEHIRIREIDYFIYLLRCALKKDGLLYVICPDMDITAAEIINTTNDKEGFDWKKFMRLNFEIFNEGNHIYDYHKTWTNYPVLKRLLSDEGFEIVTAKYVYIDTDLVPQIFIKAKAV